MNNEKYNLSLGFATLIISLSAFKDELANIHFYLGLTQINMAQYLFYSILTLCAGLYLHFSEQLYSQLPVIRKINLKILHQISYFIIVLVIISPIVIIVFQPLYRLNEMLKQWEHTEFLLKILHILNFGVLIILALVMTFNRFKLKKK